MKPSKSRDSRIDGLRGVAIILVIYHHIRVSRGIPPPIWFPFDGLLGVCLFFEVSGYIITKLLCDELRERGAIALGRFYGRRSVRIFPAFYAFILCMAFSRSLGWVSFDTKDLLASIFYVRNLWPGPVSVLQHTWSLAVEEQFYIIWPVCMVLLARRHWPGLVAIGLVAKFILRLVVTAGYPNGQAALISTGFDAICCGVAIALWMDGREGKPAIFEPSSAFSRFDLVPVLCVGCLFVLYDKAYLWSGRATVLEPLLRDVLVGTLLLYCISRTSGVLIGVLTSRWLVGIGLVSYSMYLWQQPFFVGKFDTWSDVVLRFPFFAAASLLSYFLVERTGLRLKRHFSADPGRMRPN